MVTDPIADFLTRIRNAQMANHRIVEIPASNFNFWKNGVQFSLTINLQNAVD